MNPEYGIAFGFITLIVLLVYCEVNREKWKKQDKEEEERVFWIKSIKFWRGDKDWWKE